MTESTAESTAQTDALLVRAAAMLDARIGLKTDLSFRPRLARALLDVAKREHLDAAGLLAAAAVDGPVLDDLIGRVTVQETAFFRHPEQFQTLVDVLLPTIAGPVHAWSAACSNGQEPYSLAMTLREHGRVGTVLATDVAPDAVRRTIDGIYDQRELSGVSPQRLQQHFTTFGDGGMWRVQQPVRAFVTARRHNLLAPIPSEVGRCQIVFCRNVLIYFSAEHATRFLDRLAHAMAPTAHLVIGATETISHVDDRFEAVRLGACYAYRPRPHARPRRAVGPSSATAVVGTRAPGVDDQPSRPERPDRRPRLSAAARTETTTAARANPPTMDAVPPPPDARTAGNRLLAAGEDRGAVVEFRRWAYDHPDDPLAHFHLGTALAGSGHPLAARRAFCTALNALDSAGPQLLDRTLEGYELGALRALLVAKCSAGPVP